MARKIIVPGLFGGLTLIVLTLVVDGILGLNSRIKMKLIPDESRVYEVLKENIIEPGRYICNPELSSSFEFPEGEPVFSILYGGMGHEAAGG